jgi:hypothetical protein
MSGYALGGFAQTAAGSELQAASGQPADETIAPCLAVGRAMNFRFTSQHV